MSICSSDQLREAGIANRSRTVVLSAMCVVTRSGSQCLPGVIRSPLAAHLALRAVTAPVWPRM